VEWAVLEGLVHQKHDPKRSEKRSLTTDVACRADLVTADRSNYELSKYRLSWLRHVLAKKAHRALQKMQDWHWKFKESFVAGYLLLPKNKLSPCL
jgi:hypothetical protein